MIAFMAYMPRSGSTLLAALLNQHPDLYATGSSNLFDLVSNVIVAWEQNPATKASGADRSELISTIRGLIDGRYAHVSNKLVVDKHHGWARPQVIDNMREVYGNIKIIAPVRSMLECATSYISLLQPENIEAFCGASPHINELKLAWSTIATGMKKYPESILLVEYDDLVDNPNAVIRTVTDFLNVSPIEIDPENVWGKVAEDDSIWQTKGLHEVRSKIRRQETSFNTNLIKPFFVEFPNFWGEMTDAHI